MLSSVSSRYASASLRYGNYLRAFSNALTNIIPFPWRANPPKVVLLAVEYDLSDPTQLSKFLADFNSKVLFTYRSSFAPIQSDDDGDEDGDEDGNQGTSRRNDREGEHHRLSASTSDGDLALHDGKDGRGRLSHENRQSRQGLSAIQAAFVADTIDDEDMSRGGSEGRAGGRFSDDWRENADYGTDGEGVFPASQDGDAQSASVGSPSETRNSGEIGPVNRGSGTPPLEGGRRVSRLSELAVSDARRLSSISGDILTDAAGDESRWSTASRRRMQSSTLPACDEERKGRQSGRRSGGNCGVDDRSETTARIGARPEVSGAVGGDGKEAPVGTGPARRRKKADARNTSSVTTDAGWGCMLRVTQMALMQCLVTQTLGRHWRRQAVGNDKQEAKVEGRNNERHEDAADAGSGEATGRGALTVTGSECRGGEVAGEKDGSSVSEIPNAENGGEVFGGAGGDVETTEAERAIAPCAGPDGKPLGVDRRAQYRDVANGSSRGSPRSGESRWENASSTWCSAVSSREESLQSLVGLEGIVRDNARHARGTKRRSGDAPTSVGEQQDGRDGIGSADYENVTAGTGNLRGDESVEIANANVAGDANRMSTTPVRNNASSRRITDEGEKNVGGSDNSEEIKMPPFATYVDSGDEERGRHHSGASGCRGSDCGGTPYVVLPSGSASSRRGRGLVSVSSPPSPRGRAFRRRTRGGTDDGGSWELSERGIPPLTNSLTSFDNTGSFRDPNACEPSGIPKCPQSEPALSSECRAVNPHRNGAIARDKSEEMMALRGLLIQFMDRQGSAFSVHNIVRAGRRRAKERAARKRGASEWFGPTSCALAVVELINDAPLASRGLKAFAFEDGVIYTDMVRACLRCRQDPSRDETSGRAKDLLPSAILPPRACRASSEASSQKTALSDGHRPSVHNGCAPNSTTAPGDVSDHLSGVSDVDFTGEQLRSVGVSSKVKDPTRAMDEGSVTEVRGVVLLLCLRLGLERLNVERYQPALQACFSIPQFQGIAGGGPTTSAYYFVAANHENLYFLDPHVKCQKAFSGEKRDKDGNSPRKQKASGDCFADETDFEFSEFFPEEPRQLPWGHLNPSMTLTFLCQSLEDFEDLRCRLAAADERGEVFQMAARPPDYEKLLELHTECRQQETEGFVLL